MMDRLKELADLGQSVWLDSLSRELIESGTLARLVRDDGVTGVTSNPAIFEKAFATGKEYDSAIRVLVDAGSEVGAIYQRLAIDDIRGAADVLAPVHAASGGADGYVSLEVSPYLARDAAGTVAEARMLWDEIGRANVMIKVPATREGLTAICDLTADGIPVNATLIFAVERYREVAEAYIAGLERRPSGAELSGLASVASLFVSRVDARIDAAIDKKLADASKDERGRQAFLTMLRGKIAIANAKIAWRTGAEIFAGPRWDKLAAHGARPQRLLFASTGTKNKAYSDVLYVDALIGPGTVNTMPPETLDAFRDHGTVKLTLQAGLDDADEQLQRLDEGGISLEKVTDELAEEGVAKFVEAADSLYAALAAKRAKILAGSLLRIEEHLGGAEETIEAAVSDWTRWGAVRRLWRRDPALWTNGDEARWLGWLDIVAREHADLAALDRFREEIAAAKLSDVVLCGMGGSSLGSAVLTESFGHRPGWPMLHVLDSTDPDQIGEVEKRITLRSTHFIVASKSGATLEPSLLKEYFWSRVAAARGDKNAGKAFTAITDPGSALEKQARQEGFAHIFLGDPQIGGRFSVLSKFGLVPAAAMGMDLGAFLTETQRMVVSCGEMVPAGVNPGVRLGVMLGTLAAKFSRDKITILSSEGLHTMGAWLEQLIAESTGKNGKGLIPVNREPLGDPAVYGDDRVFVVLRLAGVDHATDRIGALAEAGHPVIHIVAEDSFQLGQLFYLWEVAVAIAGSVIGIDPFNQPDVESAKVKARALTKTFEDTGTLPESTPLYEQRGLALYADEDNAAALGAHDDLAGYLRAHFRRAEPGDYVALLAFIEQCDAFEAELNSLRVKLRDRLRTATCVGFGPRFLHSTGQAYKGGPDTGVFLVITGDPVEDIAIPGRKASFAMVERAQALGDFAVLGERGRRALRVHMKDVASGLAHLCDVFDAALS